MTTIVTRTGKGSILTIAEMDANLNNLNNDKLETSTVGVSVQAHSANLDEFATVNPTAAGLALLDDADAAAQRTTLGLVIGTDVQAYDADIPTVAASQAEMEAGTETSLRSMSPLRVAQAIAALGGGGDLANEGLMIIKGGGLNLPATNTHYARGVGLASSTTEGLWLIPPRSRVSELRVKLNASVSSGTVTFTVRKNSVDTGMTIALTAGQSAGSDVSNTVDFIEGGYFSLKAVSASLSPTTLDYCFSVVVTDYDSGKSKSYVYTTGGSIQDNSNVTGEPGTGTTLAYTTAGGVPWPACTINHRNNIGDFIQLRLNGGTLETQSYVDFYREKSSTWDGSSQNITTQQLLTYTHITDNTDVIIVPSNNPSGGTTFMLFPEAIGVYGAGVTSHAPCFMQFTAYSQAQNTTSYLGGLYISDALTGAESEVQIPMPACTLHNLRVMASATFTAGQSCVLTVRKNGVDTGLTVTVDNTNQKNADTINSVTFAAGDLLSIKSVSSATAGTKYYHACIEVLK